MAVDANPAPYCRGYNPSEPPKQRQVCRWSDMQAVRMQPPLPTHLELGPKELKKIAGT